MDTENIIYGKNAIIEALKAKNRTFNKILISQSARADDKVELIKRLASEQDVVYQFVAREKLNALEPNGNHQGVIACISPIKYTELHNFINSNKNI